MTMEFKGFQLGLWQRIFGKLGDGLDDQRALLVSELMRSRERATALVSLISRDMPMYTVHDMSHLDALWELADLIAGDRFTLNPAEGFVFGMAVLLHDAGMTLAAYDDGLSDLKKTTVWADCLAIHEAKSIEPVEEAIVIADVLRILHATTAESIATSRWKYKRADASTEDEYLMEDSGLRAHYAQTVGQIAHSHNWPVQRVVQEFRTRLGAYKEMPASWTVDLMKVALLLRCADAANIDHRRAPRFLMTLTKPSGISKIHWNFQNKLAKAHIKDTKLTFTSTSPFLYSEASSWHLCYEIVRMIDRELGDAQDILIDHNIEPAFKATGVMGAKSASALKEYIQVQGWKPVPAEIRVSDVPKLARSLGGRDLYSQEFAPLRELIQNAADAVEARVAVDNDFMLSEGEIVVRIGENDEETIIQIDDNGIGMSERTLTDALLDFGKSFWKSEEARDEFPGLQSKFSEPRGRYGIGFFSVFMWADDVSVCSHKYSDGTSSALILEFSQGLGRQPILRPANANEISTRFQTRVTLRVRSDALRHLKRSSEPVAHRALLQRHAIEYGGIGIYPFSWKRLLTVISALLPIKVWLLAGDQKDSVSYPEWRTMPHDDFVALLEGFGESWSEDEKRFFRAESEIVEDGKIVGRGMLLPQFRGEGRAAPGIFAYDRGIFANRLRDGRAFAFVEGTTVNAARDNIRVSVATKNALWLETQKRSLFSIAKDLGESLVCQDALLTTGSFSDQEDLFLINRRFVSFADITNGQRNMILAKVRLEQSSVKESFKWKKINGINAITGYNIDSTQIFALVDIPGEIVNSNSVPDWFDNGPESPLRTILKGIRKSMGDDATMKVSVIQIDSYSNRMGIDLTFSRR